MDYEELKGRLDFALGQLIKRKRISEDEKVKLSSYIKDGFPYFNYSDAGTELFPADNENGFSRPQSAPPQETVRQNAGQPVTPQETLRQNAGQPVPPPPYPPPQNIYRKPQRESSPVNVLLIIGVVFILLATVVFASLLWENLGAIGKGGIILFFSAVFFAFYVLMDKKFKLKKIGITFYLLGTAVLPISILTYSYYSNKPDTGITRLIFGGFFYSAAVNGIALLVMAASCFIGTKLFKSKFFAYSALTTTTMGAVLLSFADIIPKEASAYFVAGIAIIMVAFTYIIKSDSDSIIARIYSDFTLVAIPVLALVVSVSASGKLSAIPVLITSAVFLTGTFTKGKAAVGPFAFIILYAIGFARLFQSDNPDYIFYTIVSSAVIAAVAAELNIFGEKTMKIFAVISRVIAIAAIAVQMIVSLTVKDMTWGDISAHGIAFALFTWLTLNNKSWLKHLHPFTLLFLAIAIQSKIPAPYGFWAFYAMLCGGFLLYYFAPKFKTLSAYISYPLAILIFAIVAPLQNRIMYDISSLVLYASIAAAVMVIMVALIKEQSAIPRVFAFFAPVFLTITALSLDELFNAGVVGLKFTQIYFVAAAIFCAASYLLKNETIKRFRLPFLIFTGIYFLSTIGIETEMPILAFAYLPLAAALYSSVRQGKIAEQKIFFYAFSALHCLYISFLMNNLISSGGFAYGFFIAMLILLIASFATDYFTEKASLGADLKALTSYAMPVASLVFSIQVYSSAKSDALLLVIALIIAWLGYFVGHRGFINIASPIALIAHPFISLKLLDIWLDFASNDLRIFNLFINYLLFAAIGFFFYKRLYMGKQPLHNKISINFLYIFSAIFSVAIFSLGQAAFCWILLALLCAASLVKVSDKKPLLTAISVLIVFTWWSQKLFTLPDLISLEFTLLPLFLLCLALKFIWKEHPAAIYTTTLVAAAVSLLILYFGAIFTGETFDALFLVICDLAFLIASFAFRRKAMFITASVSILLITLTLTISKASTVYWWIYLLAAGIILIIIASVNEHYKTKGESIKGKTKHFFNTWSW